MDSKTWKKEKVMDCFKKFSASVLVIALGLSLGISRDKTPDGDLEKLNRAD